MTALDLLQAIQAGKLDKVQSRPVDDPDINSKLSGKYMLHHAAEAHQSEILKALIARGANIALLADDGDTVLHSACRLQDDGPLVAYVLGKIGPVAYNRNDIGQNPLHLAAKFNHPNATEALLEAAGRDQFNVPDKVGLTPLERAISFEATVCEQKIHAAFPDADVVGPGQNMSTVDMIVWMTKTNNPEFFNDTVIRGMVQELYDDPSLRPVLEIAALDGFGGRKTTNSGDRQAFQIFISDKTTGDQLGKGALGGFQAGNNSMTVDGRNNYEQGRGSWRDTVKGTLIHELTHHAAKATFKNDAIPLPKLENGLTDPQAELAFVSAFEQDVKTSSHLAITPEEKEVVRCLSSRMSSYAKSLETPHRNYLPKETIQMEMIVGINQAVAQYGRPMVEKLFPTFTDYHDQTFVAAIQQECTNANGLGQFNDGRVDLTADAANSEPVVPLPTKVFTATAELKLEGLVEMVRQEFLVHFGSREPGTKDLPLYSAASCLVLSENKEKELADLIRGVEKAFKSALSKDKLPPQASTEAIREMVKQVGKACCKEGANAKDVAKTALSQAKTFVQTAADEFEHEYLAARKAYLDRKLSKEYVFNSNELADLIVIQAANQVSGGTLIGANLNPGKYLKITQFMAEQIDALPPQRKAAIAKNPAAFAQSRVSVLLQDKDFLVKSKAIKKGTGHISVDVSSLKKAWQDQAFDFQVFAKDKTAYKALKTQLELECGPEAAQRLRFSKKDLRIDLAYNQKEVLDKFSKLTKDLLKAQADDEYALRTNYQDALLSMASPAARETLQQANDRAYDFLRKTPPKPPANNLNLTPDAAPDQRASNLLGNQPGICLAEEHGGEPGKQSKKFLIDNMGQLHASGVRTIFVEHLYVEYQAMVDAYLEGKNMSPVLDQALTKLDSALAEGANVRGMLDKAKAIGMRVVGIDSVTARVSTQDPLRGQRRAARMNQVAAEVIQREQKRGGKFLVLAGADHINTSPHGISGLAQILGAHAIQVDDSGKPRLAPEDQSRRNPLRPAGEQLFIDRFLDEMERLNPGSTKTALEAAIHLAGELGNRLDMANAKDQTKIARIAQDIATTAVKQIAKTKAQLVTNSIVLAAKQSQVFAAQPQPGASNQWLRAVAQSH